MSVVVPSTNKSNALALQTSIANLGGNPASSFNQQLLLSQQRDLVNSLVADGKLNAASILSTVPYRGTSPFVSTNPTQAVTELLASGQMSAAAVLATMTYIGA